MLPHPSPITTGRAWPFLMLSNKGACSYFFRHSSSGQCLLCVYYWALTYWLQNILNSGFMYLHSLENYLWPPIPLFYLVWAKNKKGQQEFKTWWWCWFFPTGDAINAVGIWSVSRMSSFRLSPTLQLSFAFSNCCFTLRTHNLARHCLFPDTTLI